MEPIKALIIASYLMTDCESVLIVMHDESIRIVRISQESTAFGRTENVVSWRPTDLCATARFSFQGANSIGTASCPTGSFGPVRRAGRWSHDEQYIAAPEACQARWISILTRCDVRRIRLISCGFSARRRATAVCAKSTWLGDRAAGSRARRPYCPSPTC